MILYGLYRGDFNLTLEFPVVDEGDNFILKNDSPYDGGDDLYPSHDSCSKECSVPNLNPNTEFVEGDVFDVLTLQQEAQDPNDVLTNNHLNVITNNGTLVNDLHQELLANLTAILDQYQNIFSSNLDNPEIQEVLNQTFFD